MGFKENWLREDEKCPTCGTVTKRVRGITKQNLKRLIKPKFTLDEMIITFMIIMVLVLAWAYQHDVAETKYWLKQMQSNDTFIAQRCNLYQNNMTADRVMYVEKPSYFNVTQINEVLNASK